MEEEEEGEEGEISHQRERRAEQQVNKDDEKRPASVKEEDTKEEVLRSQLSTEQKDNEPSKTAPVSSFFGEERFAELSGLQRGSRSSSSCLLLCSKSSQKSCCENGETRQA